MPLSVVVVVDFIVVAVAMVAFKNIGLACPFMGVRGDKGRFGSYTKLCDFTLLFMILQVELRLNKDH